ncbi:MAG: DUF1501 domain-containing protein [Bacteroidota bacterium]
MARYFISENPDYISNPPTDPPAVKIGGPTSLLFDDENSVDLSANFGSADRLDDLVQTGNLYNNIDAPDDCYYGEQVLFLRTVSNAANIYSTAIANAYNNSETEADYTSSLGDQLKLVARLIKGGLKTQLYLVTLDGFDTHVSQNTSANHLGLLADLSTAVDAFYKDLEASGHHDDVLSMTYSEFGRRVNENALSGTDHGTALPVMLFGPSLDGSDVHGKDPDLDNLNQDGNLVFGTDFRSIYATILENWMCIDPETVNTILGEDYQRLADIGINCDSVNTSNPILEEKLEHRIIPLGGGQYEIQFALPRGGDVHIDLITISGRSIKSIQSRYYHQGVQSVYFTLNELNVQLAPMVYTIRTESTRVANKFMASSF